MPALFNESTLKGSDYLRDNILKYPKDKTMFECKACKKKYAKYVIQFEGLKKHLKTPKHQDTAVTDAEKEGLRKAIALLKGKKTSAPETTEDKTLPKKAQVSIEEELAQEQDPIEEEYLRTAQEEGKTAENTREVSEDLGLNYFRFQITSFLINNNLPFSLTENLIELIRDLLKTHSAKALSEFPINRKHVSNIVTYYCVGPHFKDKHLNLLAKIPYSISLDEGKTKDNLQYLAINARFLPTEDDIHTQTRLLGLVQLGESKTGNTIFNMLQDFLFTGEEGHLRRKNLIGVASDHASNMISSRDSGATD